MILTVFRLCNLRYYCILNDCPTYGVLQVRYVLICLSAGFFRSTKCGSSSRSSYERPGNYQLLPISLLYLLLLILLQNGVFLAPVMSVPFLLFSGFFVFFDAIPVYLRWITYLSYIRYDFEGTALATYGFNRAKLQCFVSYCHFKSPQITLEELDMVNSSYLIDVIALIAIFVFLRVAAYMFLKWKLKTNH